jgi:hypothetical protein
MKNYLTVEQLDKNKTYYSYVDVAVKFVDRDSRFMEKLPSNKKEMERFNQLKNMIAESEEDFAKFYEKGNKTAGTRSRALLQEIKASCQEGRTHIQATKTTATKA